MILQLIDVIYNATISLVRFVFCNFRILFKTAHFVHNLMSLRQSEELKSLQSYVERVALAKTTKMIPQSKKKIIFRKTSRPWQENIYLTGNQTILNGSFAEEKVGWIWNWRAHVTFCFVVLNSTRKPFFWIEKSLQWSGTSHKYRNFRPRFCCSRLV